VRLAALKGEKTLAEPVQLHAVHMTQIAVWTAQLLEAAAGVFGTGSPIRSGQAFWRRPPVDEPGPEAGTDRSGASGVVDHTSVRADIDQPVGLLPPACGRDAGEAGADAAIAGVRVSH
jgi:hypothetical protein